MAQQGRSAPVRGHGRAQPSPVTAAWETRLHRPCHDPRVPVNEEGPGIGVWVALGVGLLAGVFVGWPVAGLLGFVVAAVVVGLISALFLM
jgi:hypothetical protein